MHSDKTLRLFFPQWQGAGQWALYEGAKLIYDALQNRVAFTEIATAQSYSLAIENNILGYHQLLAQLKEATDVIRQLNPDRILTIGGDCGVEIAPVSFLRRKYGSTLGVIWLDAHGDLNTPTSSPSGHFHGMPLRVLLGEGDPALVVQLSANLLPEQLVLVGGRDLDAPERQFIDQQGISIISAAAINQENYGQLLALLASSQQLYIHLDLDVLDPKAFPHVACPTPGGIQIKALKKLLTALSQRWDVVGCSVLEFLPQGSKAEAIAALNPLLDSILAI